MLPPVKDVDSGKPTWQPGGAGYGRRSCFTLGIAGFIASVVVCLVASVCGSFLFYAVNSQPFTPSADELLPVPKGLHATVEEPTDLACGSGMCGLRITVTGTRGQSSREVYKQVRQHLSNREWDLDRNGQACRPNGRLFDRRDLCVSVSSYDGAVHVNFEGWRAWP